MMNQLVFLRLSCRVVLFGLAAALISSLTACGGSDDSSALATTWSTPMLDFNNQFPGVFPAPAPVFYQDQTVRQRMRIGAGGRAVRVQISNAFGSAPITIDGVHVARPASSLGAAQTDIDTASDTAVTFNGSSSATLAAGGELWSDEVIFDAPERGDLIVSLYVANQTQIATFHAFATQEGAVVTGNALSSAGLTNPATINSYYWVSKIDARSDTAKGAIVVLGDSITDGAGTVINSNTRWPNRLDARLAATSDLKGLSVINAGVVGNRLLTTGVGPRAVDRFVRDVMGATDAKGVIVLLGVNDISIGDTIISQAVTAQQIIDGLTALVINGRAAGLKVYLATIMPYKGWARFPWTYASEAKRTAVNAWIRTAGVADGLIDFDAVMRNPADPATINPVYDSGDHLHPNAVGTQAMADCVDPALFAGL